MLCVYTKAVFRGVINPLVVLDGTAIQVRGNLWEPSCHVTIEELEDINPAPSLLDDGDV